MKRFSNSFWLVEVPIIVAYIHFLFLCVCFGVFPRIGNYIIEEALMVILLWPGELICWIFGRNSATYAIGLVLSFLWAPGIAFWGTRAYLKRKDKRVTVKRSASQTRLRKKTLVVLVALTAVAAISAVHLFMSSDSIRLWEAALFGLPVLVGLFALAGNWFNRMLLITVVGAGVHFLIGSFWLCCESPSFLSSFMNSPFWAVYGLFVLVLLPLSFFAVSISEIRHILRVEPAGHGRRKMKILLACLLAASLGIAYAIFLHMQRVREESRLSTCAGNLCYLRDAVEQYAMAHGLTKGVVIDPQVLQPYLIRGWENVICPSSKSNTYTLGPLGEEPNCSVHGGGRKYHLPNENKPGKQ